MTADARLLSMAALRRAYQTRELTPTRLAEELGERLESQATPGVWIHRRHADALRAAAQVIEEERDPALPLYGIPFAVKDNIDVAGMPTTAACPGWGHLAETSATVVERLLAAGALLVGKLDADGLARQTTSPFPLARLVAASALARRESRGGHYRSDFPELDPVLDGRHAIISGEAGPVLEAWE